MKLKLYYSVIYSDQYETLILKEYENYKDAKKFFYTARNLKGQLLKNAPGYSIAITTWIGNKQTIYKELTK